MSNIQTFFEQKKNLWFSLLGFFVLSLAFFGSSIFFPFFVFDDFNHIAQNPNIPAQSLSDLIFFWKDSSTPLAFNFWQLIAAFTHTEHAYAFRFINILNHGLNASLLALILRTLYPKAPTYFAFLIISVFLIHPLQVESIVWISSSRGVLSTTFLLLSLLTYLRFRNLPGTFCLSSFVFFFVSVLIKPSSLILPILLLLIERVIFSSSFKQILSRTHFYFYPAIALGIVHINDLLTIDFGRIDLSVRILHSIEALHHYLAYTLFPIGLKFNYGLTYLQTSLNVLTPLKLLFPIVSLSLVIFSLLNALIMKRKHHWCLWVLCFFISVLPTLGLIPFDFQNISTVADRYLYLGVAFLIFSLCSLHSRNPKITVSLAGLYFLVFIFLTPQRIYQWSDQPSLILSEATLENTPPAVLPSLALAYSQNKDCNSIHHLVESHPDDHAQFLTFFFTCLLETQNHQLALQYFDKHYAHLADSETLILRARVHMMINRIEGFYYDLRQISYLSVSDSQQLIHFVPKDTNSLESAFVPQVKQLFSSTLFHHRPDWAASLIEWIKSLEGHEYQELVDEMALSLQNYRQLTQ